MTSVKRYERGRPAEPPVGCAPLGDWGWVLRIELRDIAPCIYRVVVVPARITLPRLHRVIQQAMGWKNRHLHEFVIAGQRYGRQDPDWPDPGLHSAQRVSLVKALGAARTFGYDYDFGDGWQHEIRVIDARADPLHPVAPRCLDGARACPPEDVGGAPGYADFLQALADPLHPQHDDRLLWHGRRFEAEAFDLAACQQRLARLRV